MFGRNKLWGPYLDLFMMATEYTVSKDRAKAQMGYNILKGLSESDALSKDKKELIKKIMRANEGRVNDMNSFT